MTKFIKDKMYDIGFLSIKEECAKFYLSSGGSHQFENCVGYVDGTIDLNWRTITGKCYQGRSSHQLDCKR